MADEQLQPGDTIREEDPRGRLVELWVVVSVRLTARGEAEPFVVRRALRPRAAVEGWPLGVPWSRSHHRHSWQLPPEGR